MKKLLFFKKIRCSRSLTLSSRSADYAFSEGFVPLEGSEGIDSVYNLVKAGHFVAPLHKIETIHDVFVGINSLCRTEFPIFSAEDVRNYFVFQDEILKKLLIRRDFWVLKDFNDPELNRSYGLQNFFFDNYKWSQVLWKKFQLFVEEYYPLSEHSHLVYQDYLKLIHSFSIFEKGVAVHSLLPKYMRLHPPYGICSPTRVSTEPLFLLKNWIEKFKRPLKINKALVVDCGCGASAFALSHWGISFVCGVDPRPRAINQCRADGRNYSKFCRTKFEVAEFLPTSSGHSKFDLILFFPDEDCIQMLTMPSSNLYAPSDSGIEGKFEQFFDDAGDLLSDNGVIVICTTNLMSFLKPFQAHPVEFEVKVNRRFVILDYFDCPFKGLAKAKYLSSSLSLPHVVSQQARSELWVLHKVSAIDNFSHFHGIPGSASSSCNLKWSGSPLSISRLQSLRSSVECLGGEWGTYKSRLLTSLQERTDIEEDDMAESVRMTLDVTFPEKLAGMARERISEKLQKEKEFNTEVGLTFTSNSPRELFDLSH